MRHKKLCPHCETGRITYELDNRSAVCPYLSCYNGKECSMYRKIENAEKYGVLRCFIDWVRGLCTPPKNNPISVLTKKIGCKNFVFTADFHFQLYVVVRYTSLYRL